MPTLQGLQLDPTCSVVATRANPYTFARDGVAVPNGMHLVDITSSVENAFQITFKTRPGLLDTKTGVYGKSKQSVSISRPHTLASGGVVFDTIRIELEIQPRQYSQDSINEMKSIALDLLSSTDAVDFWNRGSLA